MIRSVRSHGLLDFCAIVLPKKRTMKSALQFTFICFILFQNPLAVFSQEKAEIKRVSFTISNPTFKAKDLDIRYFYADTKETAGYGFHLGPFHSHADNKPVGTRVYLKIGKEYQLAFVLAEGDNGRRFNLSKAYTISREQMLQAARDEEGERIAKLENPDDDDDLAAFAKRYQVPMVSFVVTGKGPLKRLVHVRAQLPFVKEKTNTGFSRKLSSFNRIQLSYPVGTKIYLCDGPYWNGDSVKETLLLVVEPEKEHFLIRI